jgi:hypothetical protein
VTRWPPLCGRKWPRWRAQVAACRRTSRVTRARWPACCSTAPTPPCWCARRQPGTEFHIALPQTGQFADLAVGESVAFGFDPERALCFAGSAMPPDAEPSLRLHAANAAARTADGAGAAVAVRPDRAAACGPGHPVAAGARGAGRIRTQPAPSTRPSSTSRCTGTPSCVRRCCRSWPPLATLLLAFPIAWTIAKIARGRTRSAMFVMCLIPFWVSETVRTLGWMILLRESGVLPAFLVQLGSPHPVELLYRDAPCWSAWSTPRCCSWWCR